MDGKIIDIEIPNPANPSVAVEFARNLDRVSFYGFELGAELMNLSRYFTAGAAFSVNGYKLNRTQDKEAFVMSSYPKITTSGFLLITPVRKLEIMPRLEYVSSRYAYTAGWEKDKLAAYRLVNIRAKYELCDYLSVTAGINNIFDKLYSIRYRYPMAGRSYAFSLTYNY